MRCKRTAVMRALILLFGASTASLAQHRPVALEAASDQTANTAPPDTAAIARDSLSGMRWMVSGRRDWSHYTTPGMCLSAVTGIDLRQWRRKEGVDTAEAHTSNDTTARDAVLRGRACLARFSAQQVPVRELVHLRDLAIAVGDAPVAKAAITRLVAVAPDTVLKLDQLTAGITALVDARDDYIALADTLYREYSRFGRIGRVRALTVGIPVSASARATFDTTDMWRRASTRRSELAALRPTPAEVVRGGGPGGVQALDYTGTMVLIDALRRPLETRDDADSVVTHGVDWYRREIWSLYPDSVRADSFAVRFAGPESYRKFFRGLVWQNDTVVKFGTLAYSVEPRDTAPRPATVPTFGGVIGKVTVVLPMLEPAGADEAMVARVLRLYRKYKDAGLTVVMTYALQGKAFSSPPLQPRTEANVMGWYLHTYRQLPWPLMVYRSTGTYGTDPYFQILTRDGKRVRPIETSYPQNDAGLEACIRRALGLPFNVQ